MCLKTFTGCCANPSKGHNHYEQYSEATGNCIFVNIKMVPKAPEQPSAASSAAEEPAAQKVTKLAIGKPGGIDAETDKYDTNASCHCRKC